MKSSVKLPIYDPAVLYSGHCSEAADSQIACSFDTMVGIATGKMTLPSAVIGGLFKVKGNKNILRRPVPLMKEAMRGLTKSLQVCCCALSIPKPP